jgi:hypothetical protein
MSGSSLGKKAPNCFSLLFFFSFHSSPNKQKTASIRIKPYNILDLEPMKSLPTSQCMPFLPDSWLQTCLLETAEDTGEQHVPQATPLPTPDPGKIIQCSPWAD